MKKTLFIAFASVWFAFNLTVMAGCKKTDPGTPGKNEVFLQYKTFNPTQLKVQVGTTVTFTNKDNANHTATANSKLFDSGKIASGNSYSYTFNSVGTYYFYCNYHSSVSQEQGVVVVQ